MLDSLCLCLAMPVGTVFFEWDHGSGMRDILSTQTSCGGYAPLRDRILNSSKKVGAPASLFPQSFFDQYKAAKAASSAS